ncbi:type II toxin-antitoxin system HipA family toxin [Legionella shakespearei]|uniref:HipA protein, DNA binding regulator n=1 Tax=Legionella shakespearei DSM 23087 TaxID=1122169 RepID=A0A0W0YTY3_9GAMM|nr:HipA domain-containing protein [Legionella shakespearei]KTD60035.1 HipA protein, DNA binding regulator [Legionella shakespearei DSM 23087]
MNNYKDINKLIILKNSEFAGILQRTNQGCEFELNPHFIQNTKAPYFSYCIPKNSANIVIHGDNLPPFFAGLLPEGRRLNALISKIKTSKDDLFSLFAAVGTDCVGDIYVEDHERTGVNAPPRLDAVNFYSYFEETIAPDSLILDTKSLAGVQEKISASMISFPLNIAKKDKTYILKLNPEDKNNLIQNELQCLLLAKKCGFDVAKAKIVTDKDNNSGLLVERFDRNNQIKLHQEDACQFLNRYPADKYRISINQIADALMQITNAPQLEILNLLRQYVFSYLICNGDLHAKNISLHTLEDGTITLTPLYDLICTAIYSDFKMALKIDGRDDNIKRKTFIDFAERYKISAKAINTTLDNLIARFVNHYQSLYLIDMPENKRNLLHRMITKRIGDLRATK